MNEDGSVRDGDFVQHFRNGVPACEGAFDQGRKTGVWTYYFASGHPRAVGRYGDDRMTGEWTWYHDGGGGRVLQTGGFDAEERKSGAWRRFHPDGTLADESWFEAGKKQKRK